MANQILSVHAVIYGMGIYAIILPSGGFSVAHWMDAIINSYHYAKYIKVWVLTVDNLRR